MRNCQFYHSSRNGASQTAQCREIADSNPPGKSLASCNWPTRSYRYGFLVTGQLHRHVSLGHKNVSSYSRCFGCGNKTVKGRWRILWTEYTRRKIVPVLFVQHPWLYSKLVGVHHDTYESCNLIGPFHLDCENSLVNCMTPEFPGGFGSLELRLEKSHTCSQSQLMGEPTVSIRKFFQVQILERPSEEGRLRPSADTKL